MSKGETVKVTKKAAHSDETNWSKMPSKAKEFRMSSLHELYEAMKVALFTMALIKLVLNPYQNPRSPSSLKIS